MRKFFVKYMIFAGVIMGILGCINYIGDPANLFHKEILAKINEYLSQGNTVSVPSDMDERLFQKARIDSLGEDIDTYILGSSHIMYIPWEYPSYYCAGVSGAMLEDDIAIFGMIEDHDNTVERVIICVDPWLFLDNTEENRYQSIEEKYEKEYKRITGRSLNKQFSDSTFISSETKELFSPSYFRSSVKSIMRTWVLHDNNREVEISQDDSINEKAKILPNGTRIPSKSDFKSEIVNSENAFKNIESNSVYHILENSSLSEEKMFLFRRFLEYLLRKDIIVELYLPAWYSDYYQAFNENEGYSFVLSIEEYALSVGDDLNISVHGSYDPIYSDINNSDWMDDLHLKPEIGLKQFNAIIRGGKS